MRGIPRRRPHCELLAEGEAEDGRAGDPRVPRRWHGAAHADEHREEGRVGRAGRDRRRGRRRGRETFRTRVGREPHGLVPTPGRAHPVAETREALFEVQSNPSLKVPPEDLKAQAGFLRAVRDDLLALNAAVRRIKDVKLLVAALQKRADAIGKDAVLKDKGDALTKKLSAIADELYSPNLKTSQDSLNFLPKLDFQIAGVGGMSDTADAKPTAAALARHRELQG